MPALGRFPAQGNARSVGRREMKYRRLGNSGLLVSELALGTMTFGEIGDRHVSEAEAQRQIDLYVDRGGNHLDVANVYAGGRAEAIVGQAIKGRRSRLVISTKVRWPMGEAPNEAGLSRYHIMQAVEDSLRRLSVDAIDLLYMHGWDALTPLEESLRAFDDLVRAGKVRYIGVSNFSAWQAMKGLGLSQAKGWAPFVAAQYQYSLVVRDIENDVLGVAEAEGMGLVPWGALGGGFLSGKYRRDVRPTSSADGRIATAPDAWEESWARRATAQNWQIVDAVEETSRAHPGASTAQVALAWTLAKRGVASVIVGARSEAQLEDNLGAASLRLTEEEIALLDRVSAVPAPYPARAVNLVAR